jgi:phage-related protein
MKVEFWTSSVGRNYVGEFLAGVPAKAMKKIDRSLGRLKRYGLIPLLQSREAAKLHGYDLYELIVDFNKVFYRIFFIVRAGVCYLLSGFTKKSNHTPTQEIKTALTRAKDIDAWLAVPA